MLNQYQKDARLLERMHEMIKTGRSGTRKQFADKLGISISQLAKYIQYIKQRGIQLSFDRSQNRYIYDNQNVNYRCGFEVDPKNN